VRVLDLFSGIGGFSLGLERAGMQTVAFCEIDPYCRAVLKKHWPGVPCHEDVRTLTASDVGPIDVICGGFPCQPFSHAGKRLGGEDDRALWPEYRRLIQELRPAWVIGENVVGLVSLGLDSVLDDLEALGYSQRTFDIPACGVGAPHLRHRIWIVAHANGRGLSRSDILREQQRGTEIVSAGEALAYAADHSSERFGQHGGQVLPEQASARPCGCGSDVAHACRDGHQGGVSLMSANKRANQARGKRLAEEIAVRDQVEVRGSLNPAWVEWLMGFPIGHTALEPSETPSSRKSRKSSGGQS